MFYGIFFALAVGSVLALYFTKICKSTNPLIERIAKILVIVWMSIYFINLFLPDGLVLRTYNDTSMYQSSENIWFVMLRWCNDVAFLVLPVAVFFKKDLFIKITGYFLSIVCLINVICYFKYIAFYTSPLGAGIAEIRFLSEGAKAFLRDATFRSFYFGVMMYLELILIAYIFIRHFDVLKNQMVDLFTGKANVKGILLGLGAFLLIFLSIVPIYAPQYIFKGYSRSDVQAFDTFKMAEPFHIIWVVMVIVEGVALTLLFRKKDYETKYIVVLMLALSLVMQYNQMFTCIGEITAHRMPFQLCNMAGLFILVMLLTRSERMYHFTLVINAVGALIAMALCDTSPFGVAYVMNIHYMLEHTNVILAPILCATLGLFPKLKSKHVIDFLVGWVIYFTFILLVGGTFRGLHNLGGPNADYWDANYLFMFDKAETSSIVGFIGPLFDINFTLFNFFTFNLTQALIFLVFPLICTGVFFLMKVLLNIGKKTDGFPEGADELKAKLKI